MRKNMKKARLESRRISHPVSDCRVFRSVRTAKCYYGTQWPYELSSKADNRPLQPADLAIHPAQDTLFATVIMDGEIMYENLRHTGNNEKWLTHQLKGHGITNIRNVFLRTCDEANTLNIYVKIQDKPKDILL